MEENKLNDQLTSESQVDEAEVNEEADKEIKLPFAYDAVSVLCSAMLIIMLLFTFVFRFVGVIGPSMESTLYNGDWLIVTAMKDGFSRGDIVISTQPNAFDDEPIVKRVIATGGQKVKIDFANSQVFVDGELLQEDYVKGRTKDPESFPVDANGVGEIEVPEGKLFVMGDNREHSSDSRSGAIGMIDERYIVGKVKFRISPINTFKYFE